MNRLTNPEPMDDGDRCPVCPNGHVHSQIRFGNESRAYEWCVQKLDKAAAHTIKEQERKIVEMLAHAQAKKQVREMMGEIPDEVTALIEGDSTAVIDHEGDK